jgi:hypothetical protein
MLEQIGERPRGAGRAYAAVRGADVLGVCGYYHDEGRLILYSKVKPELRRWRKVIVRGARLAMAAASRVRAPVAALAQEDIPGSARMLQALGFEQVEDDLYWRPTWQPPAQ